MNCYYCNSSRLVRMWGGYSCEDCCTEQNEYDLVPDEYDIHYEVIPSSSIVNAHPATKKVVNIESIFSEIEILTSFSPTVISLAKAIMQECCDKKRITTEGKVLYNHALACVYISGKSSIESFKPKYYFASLSTSSSDFNKAYKNILDSLGSQYAHVVRSEELFCPVNDCMRIIQTNFSYHHDKLHTMRKILYNIHDRICDAPSLKVIHSSSLNATLVFMVHAILGQKLSMTQVSKLTGTTVASIIKTESIIKPILTLT